MHTHGNWLQRLGKIAKTQYRGILTQIRNWYLPKASARHYNCTNMIGSFRDEFRWPNHGLRLHESASSAHLSRLPTLKFWWVPRYVSEFCIRDRNSGVSLNSGKV